MNSAPYCFLAGHALTIHDPSFTIYCCSSVVYHNFVSSTFSCLKVSFKLVWSTVNVRLCITGAKCAAISSLPAFSWLLISLCLVKQHKLIASLKSGILRDRSFFMREGGGGTRKKLAWKGGPAEKKWRKGGGVVGRKNKIKNRIRDVYKWKKNCDFLFITNMLKQFQGNKKTSQQLLYFIRTVNIP